MPSANYSAWSVVAGEQPTTAKWNVLGTNDASFNSGQGFNDGIIVSRHLASGIQLATAAYNPYKFSAYQSTTISGVVDGVFTTVPYDTKVFDTSNNFNSTSGIFTAPVAGFYHFDGCLQVTGAGAGSPTYWEGRIYLMLNGSTIDVSTFYTYNETQFTNWSGRVGGLFQLAANDQIKIQAWLDTFQNVGGFINSGRNTTFSGFMVSAT